jgi:hypothetical protein
METNLDIQALQLWQKEKRKRRKIPYSHGACTLGHVEVEIISK